jgi:type VI secretion system protein VasD
MKLLVHSFSGLVAACALVGCAGPRPVMPAPYTVVISANTSINPDRENRATPVQVRLFELQNSSNFERIDFYTLFDKDEQALGADVLSKEQLTLQPGQKIRLYRKAKPEARMLGIFVAFKNLESSTWRVVTPLPQAKELGRWGLFNPSFNAAVVSVRIGSKWVAASTTGADVPVTIPGTGGLPQLPQVPQIPQVQVPQVQVPQVQVPQVQVPQVQVPQVQVPQIQVPQVRPPSYSLPTFPLSGNK